MAAELPSQFLDQEYNHEAFSLYSLNKSENPSTWSCFGSSDSGSVFSSTETESEESDEDYMAELNRQMADFMLQDDNHDHHHKRKQEKASWISSANLLPPPSTSRPLLLGSNYNQSPKIQPKQALIDYQIGSVQYYKLNLEQVKLKKQQQNPKTKRANIIYPQSSNYDTRAVFLGGSGSKTKSCCSGTGVFLPKGIGHASSDSQKQQGCSTVLIPAKVVQALKRHFDRVGVPSRFNDGNFRLQNDGSMGLKIKSSLNSQQQEQRPAPASNNPEIVDLPQEWTY